MPTGIYTRTEKMRENLRKSHIGKNIWSKGKNISDEHKQKIRKFRLGKASGMLGKHHSKETKNKMAKAHKGSKAPAWKGGITPIAALIRLSTKYKQWRTNCFIRDNFTCQKCGNKGVRLEVHHKRPFHKFLSEIKEYLPLFGLYEGAMLYNPLWDLNNGITFCKKHHYQKKK